LIDFIRFSPPFWRFLILQDKAQYAFQNHFVNELKSLINVSNKHLTPLNTLFLSLYMDITLETDKISSNDENLTLITYFCIKQRAGLSLLEIKEESPGNAERHTS